MFNIDILALHVHVQVLTTFLLQVFVAFLISLVLRAFWERQQFASFTWAKILNIKVLIPAAIALRRHRLFLFLYLVLLALHAWHF